jgi:S-DNA-T family DNA segregation ATPase FtsK/SpoIIIE
MRLGKTVRSWIEMAQTAGKKTSSSRKSGATTSRKKNSTSGSRSSSSGKGMQEGAIFHEVGLIVFFAAMVFLFLCNFGLIGSLGNALSGFLFGIFGFTAYIAPIMLFLAVSFWSANEGSWVAMRKLISGVTLFMMLGIICALITSGADSNGKYDLIYLYQSSSADKSGGGVLAGSLAYLFQHYLGTVGSAFLVLVLSVISFVLLTEKSVLTMVRKGNDHWKERALREKQYREDAELVKGQRKVEELSAQDEEEQADGTYGIRMSGREKREELRQKREEDKLRKAQEQQKRAEERENIKILRMERKVSGVMMDTALSKADDLRNNRDIHEIVLDDIQESAVTTVSFDGSKIQVGGAHQIQLNQMPPTETFWEPVETYRESIENHWEPAENHWESAETYREPTETYREPTKNYYESAKNYREPIENYREPIDNYREPINSSREQDDNDMERMEDMPPHQANRQQAQEKSLSGKGATAQAGHDIKAAEQLKRPVIKKYVFPSLSMLTPGLQKSGNSSKELRDTAVRLQQILATFGVNVTVTDVSQGPSVTRYELSPEQGVKVSKIVSLTDDIKLNLAATDIRMEAPIPGKAAIGIEVPNKENMTVALRDLLNTKEFKEFPSNLAFAVGKDIGGNVVVSDIARMPHMLIAGATGSGKSVCINTLIMSLLYKAHPEDVKLIMIDPKVVELSVYNGIPHLLIPVVTDPKKAAAALHWGVSEMTQRYQKFADYNVRDLKGFNKRVESLKSECKEAVPDKMPQIVIIVDELADLMMVAPGEVEESICRLAQLARAAGIHLIIATQRPSVDVITGLIKANMPSRAAFAVSSGVDSRTILDMNGAEKLLGKGDMLFYPQGYSKPARIQGAFVSDKEVSDVEDFLKNQAIGSQYVQEVEDRIQNGGFPSGESSEPDNERDEYFEEAGRFLIDKDKASIGMLQRVLKIGFNRASRIMDQLCQYGVVGEEEGTKPRKVQMTREQFESMLESEQNTK